MPQLPSISTLLPKPRFYIASRDGITGFGIHDFFNWCKGTEHHRFEPENVFVNDEESARARHLELKAVELAAEWAKTKTHAELVALGVLAPDWED